MARPRKEDTGVDARQRIQDAFWLLLEEYQLREITIGTITAQANCNRGTFYYHYRDLDNLIQRIIENEILGKNALAENLFRVITGANFGEYLEAYAQSVHRISLLLNRGGMDMVIAKVCPAVKTMWQAVLCPDGECLSREAEAIIEFNVGGILTLLVLNGEFSGDQALNSRDAASFVSVNSQIAIERLSKAQGLSADEIATRLTLAKRFMGTMQTQR